MRTTKRIRTIPAPIPRYECSALPISNRICAYHFRINLYQFLFLLYLCVLPGLSRAQSPVHYFKNYQLNQGLFSNTITSITQDEKGFMWFGTRNGLNRFDGKIFRTYKYIPGDSSSLGSNSILSLYSSAASKNNNHHSVTAQLWIGTAKGLYLYLPEQDKFKRIQGIPGKEIQFITRDHQQNIWIICHTRLYSYHQKSKRIKEYAFKNEAALSLHLSEKGTLWVATTAGNLKRMNPGQQTFFNYSLPGINPIANANTINSMYSLGDTTLILGTGRQLLSFNLKTNTLRDIGRKNNTGSLFVHTIAAPSSKELWLGTETGLAILNTETLKTKLITKADHQPSSLTDNIVTTIYKDQEGATWLGTYFGGINYYSKEFNYFQKYYPDKGNNKWSGNLVHEICRDQYGNLWIGTEDAGLNKMEMATGRIFSYQPDGKKGSLSYHNIHGLVADEQQLWIGTFDHGLDVMDIKTGKVTKRFRAGKANNQLKSNFIVSLYRSPAGHILVGTWNGLFRYQRNTDDFSPVKDMTSHVQSILEDRRGTLWVGTYGSGVYYYPQGSTRKKQLAAQKIPKNVNSIFEDHTGKIWICTEEGLYGYDPLKKQLKSYTTANGLPNMQVFRMLEDKQGLFWISTGKGLCRFNPKTNSYTNFYAAEGLPTEQFNYNSSYKDQNGRLYFGTLKGMISFDPEKIVSNPFVVPVYLSNLQVNNSDIDKGPYARAINQDIGYTSQLSLPHTASNLNFDIVALSYLNSDRNRYQYKLKGIDQQWISSTGNKRIYYNKLSAGNYTFMLRGLDKTGAWNPKITSLHIKISPPWWQSTLAYVLYVFLFSGVAAILIRYYRKALVEKNKRKTEALERRKEQEIYAAKIDFFTNVAHEIRTPLTLIKMPLDKLLKKYTQDPELNDNLMMMKKNTNRLIDLSNELLDFRKAEANKFNLNFILTDINTSLTEWYTLFKPIAEEKSLLYHLELPRMPLLAFVDTEAFRKIINNLISNAIKYGSSEVTIKLVPFSSEDDFFHVEFRNDGHLIDAEMTEKIFEPFYRIRGDHTEQGTGIGLPLARSLAELHKGSLALKKAANENVFLLSLPIHQGNEREKQDQEPEESTPLTALSEKTSGPVAPKPGILLVEDNKDILNYLTHELAIDYQILTATNGLEALQLLQNEQIQLVISDIMMPVMDGVALCKKIKGDFQFSHIPVILLTARTSVNAKIEGLEAGADAYIEKPFSLEHVHAQVSNLLINRNIIKDYFASSPLTHMKSIAYAKADIEFLEKLNTYICSHISEMNLDVEQLSNLMNVSKATLYRKIKGLSNLTPNELINVTRLKKSAELLASGAFKINEVANQMGYSVPSNFSRDFQRQFGMSPSVYVQKIKTLPRL